MIRAATWAGANPAEETERYVRRRSELAAPQSAARDVDDRLQRMESMLNSLLDGLQSSPAAQKPSRAAKEIIRPQHGEPIAELGYRPAGSHRDERPSMRSELQRRQWPRSGSPDAWRSKIATFQENGGENAAMKRTAQPATFAPALGSDELQTEIANVGATLHGLDSRDSIGALERAICGLTQTVEGLRSEAVNETVLQPLEKLVGELQRSLALIDVPKTSRGTEAKAAGSDLESGRPRFDQDALHRIEQQANKVRDLFAPNAERARVVEPLQRRPRSETSDRQRPTAAAAAPHYSDMRALAKIEQKLETIAANIEEVTAQSRDESRYAALSERIDDVRQELTTRIAEAWLSPDTKPLEDLLHGLSEKLENVQNSQAAKHALEALEQQVADLSEQFERANARLPSLASIEMAIGDLFTEIERTREVALNAAEQAARNVLNEASADGTLGVEISKEIQRLRTIHDDADRRTLSTLTTIHDVLGKLVERLAVVEGELSERQKAVQADVAPRPSSPQQRELSDFKSERIAQGQRRAQGRPRADAKADAIPIWELEGTTDQAREEERGARSDLTFAAHRAAQAAIGEGVQRQPGASSAGFFGRVGNVFKRSMVLAITVGLIGVGAYILANDAGLRRSIHLASNTNIAAVESRPRDPPVPQASAPPPRIAAAAAPAAVQSPSHPAPPHQAANPVPESSAQLTQSIGSPARTSEQVAETSPSQANSGLSPEEGLTVTPSAEPDKIDSAQQPADSITAPAVGKARHFSTNAPHDLRVAAEGGNADAQFMLAAYYTQSHNLAAAARWYQAAATQGLAPAQFRLGLVYQNGLGMSRDLDEANSWYLKAAEQGNVSAMYNLALLAANGKPDYATAARWFKKAAEYGMHNGQYNFAVLLAYGLGVKQDLVSSYAWFAIAAAQGDQGAAEKRDEIGGKLDSKQLAAANALVASFHPKTPDPAANEVPRRDYASSAPAHESASIAK